MDAQRSRTKSTTSAGAVPDSNLVRRPPCSPTRATRVRAAVSWPTIVMFRTSESPAIAPEPSHATPENVCHAANAYLNLHFGAYASSRTYKHPRLYIHTLATTRC